MPTNGYNDTLNLPKTDFPMKANLPEKEAEFFKQFEDSGIYSKLMSHNNGKPVYVLHDGPPYANGDIHLGHALNKILKDFVVRFKNISGYRSPYIPGWDTHGLPTELKARKKADIKNSQEISDIELRKICKEFAMGYVNTQREQFKRLGLLGDWNNPYITLEPKFEAKQIEVFSKMASDGAIYRGLKPVYWCSGCETALAEAEIEYKDDDCESIYVKFKVKEDNGVFHGLNIDISNVYFVIWTTTTWTLPGNTAICLGSDIEYCAVKHGSEYYIVAKDRCKESMKDAEIKEYEIVSTIKGSKLEGIKTYHPFLERDSVVILGDHVTTESGTGCVHTAPGHGVEDFEVCSKYDNIPIIVPVNSRGVLTKEAGQFCGMHISKANGEISRYLREKGLLFAAKKISHSYPHCWRCKKPIIFRATKQWFCSIEKFKDKAIRAVDDVEWIPKWGKDRMRAMIVERKDWCISRQRKWGVPIPIFFCNNCSEPLIDEKTMKNVADIFKKEGSDSWYINEAGYFIAKGTRCTNCGHEHFSKETDIMDVWFDSGVTNEVVCKKECMGWPADLYLEGADQYRGWFQSSILTSIAFNGQAPYKAVATHGWVVDEEGEKQSKSVGNGINPSEIIDRYGADVLRLWVASSDYHTDVKISHDILKQLCESYRKIRNTARFIISNLYDFDPNKISYEINDLFDIDKFMLYKVYELNQSAVESYNSFEFHEVFHSIQKFCIVDLSNFYLDILKDRLYVYGADSVQRRSAQFTIYKILSVLVKLLAPMLAYTSEEIWKYMPHKSDENIESILFNSICVDDGTKKAVNQELIEKFSKIQALKNDIRKILEKVRKDKFIGSSLEAKVTIYSSDLDVYKFLCESAQDLKDVLIVSEVEILNSGSGKYELEKNSGVSVTIFKAGGQKCERCWTYSNTVGKNVQNPDLCNRCVSILK
ncbi:MAG: isoleucine--tRNA ligase [Oscillospiraceae bacterium]|jgi:isoleucyl-tRNA synthetase|nr:isoleucine--tRNA ligase [Oscillospiraceae bacterium]